MVVAFQKREARWFYKDHVGDPSKERVIALPKVLEASGQLQAFLVFDGKNGLHFVVSMDIVATMLSSVKVHALKLFREKVSFQPLEDDHNDVSAYSTMENWPNLSHTLAYSHSTAFSLLHTPLRLHLRFVIKVAGMTQNGSKEGAVMWACSKFISLLSMTSEMPYVLMIYQSTRRIYNFWNPDPNAQRSGRDCSPLQRFTTPVTSMNAMGGHARRRTLLNHISWTARF